ncbi:MULTISPECIES: methyl-accepting chemotaxis protein [unclassified Photobacterium]|uniref:methyl-accepting chemotaxis protein n=1 Tax=unclassified Photobacterium TaxID=2628852 RepID=UPI001EDFA300|nr:MULTISPECIES: methyl-accepting chemotaxis protein [unclassified Photobacterium]MCG3865905.1 methyl-accepting chemotaxis protein [Photobacterium sp. Ph6]MCG3877480.1 methyl-accepting chemotaxis protein [Photobacterium sp. Ph5]
MQLTLKQKLIVASLSAVLVMATALTWLAANQIDTQAKNELYTRASSLTAAVSGSIDDWVSIRTNIIDSVAIGNSEVAMVPSLKQARLAGQFEDIYFGSTAGIATSSFAERDLSAVDPRPRPWYQQAQKANETIISSAYMDTLTKAKMVTIAKPIYSNSTFIGVIGADILITQLIDDIVNLNVGQNAFAMLINKKDATFIAHPDQQLLLQPISRYSNALSINYIEQQIHNNALANLTINDQPKLLYFANIPHTDWILAINMDKKTEEASHKALLYKLLLTAAVIALLVITTVAWLVNFLFRDLDRVSNALAEIASGKGDLTQRIEPKSNDEVGQLANNFNQFVGNMHQMVARLSHVSQSLSQQSHLTATQAEERSTRIQHQQDEINMVATAINEMAAATKEIASNAENTARTAEETVMASNHGATQVNQSQQSISSLAQEVETATTVISDLNSHAQSINTILSTIQGIAEQTNLLALNAAIEAARAGEQGRGFAVVADEVRVLSQRTHASTQEIQQMIETLQQTTGQAVGIMEDSRHLSETSVDDASSASASLAQITSAVNNINDMATQIASAAEEQSSVTSEITRNTEGIRDVSNELAVEANEAAKQAAELSELSYELQQEINRFKL